MSDGDDSKYPGMRATAVPGMRITLQFPISPDGKTIAWEIVEDQTAEADHLDELTERAWSVTRRLSALEELPIIEASLYKCQKLLVTARKERAMAVAQAEAARDRSPRRNPKDAANPQDMQRITQYDARVLQIEEQIIVDEARIPYLKAIIARQPLPSALPVLHAVEAAE